MGGENRSPLWAMKLFFEYHAASCDLIQNVFYLVRLAGYPNNNIQIETSVWTRFCWHHAWLELSPRGVRHLQILLLLSRHIRAAHHVPLTRYANNSSWACAGNASFPRLASPICITTRASRTCRDDVSGSLTNGFLWSRWRGKRSRHSRCMRNPQFCVSGKRPIVPHYHIPTHMR